MYRLWHLDQCQCVPFCVDKLHEFHWTSYCSPVALKANLLFDVCLDEWVLSGYQLNLSFHICHPESLLQSVWGACLQLGCETCLPWRQIVQIQTFRWTKWDGAMKPFHVSIWAIKLYSSLGKKVCTQDDVVFDVIIVKHRYFCWLMHLFLSNSGNLMSCIVTTSCILRRLARILTSLVSPSNFAITPFGKADLLIRETFKPESKSTQKSLQLLMVPIVPAV